jgi:ketosteroid isomerase-like protein
VTAPDIQVLADKLAIHDVLVTYGIALDARDWDRLSTCFLPDAELIYEPLPPFTGFESLRMAMEMALTPCTTQHLIANVTATVDGDTAEGWSYGQATHRRIGTEGGDLFVTGGAYEDRLVRADDGSWRIARRHVHAQWTWGNPKVVGLDEAW